MADFALALRRLSQHHTTSAWVSQSCGRRLVPQHRQLSGTSIGARHSREREPLPLVPSPAPGKHEKAKPLDPLVRPIGQPEVPQPGDNAHYDLRPFVDRMREYFDNHEAKRQWLKPHFQPWSEIRHHRGKRFIANARPFREDVALYFPNLQGYTLADTRNVYDTTKALKGKVSIVRMMNEYWSTMQCDSWMDEVRNPDLVAEMERLKYKGLQTVHINITELKLRAFFVWLYTGWHKKQIPKEEWARCFMVRKGVTDYIRRDIRMPNPKVGHIYLLDQNCKIRWAGCGDATDEERESLVNAVRRLVEPKEFLAEFKEKAASNAGMKKQKESAR